MKKEFIPYELALELQKLGFDDGCLTYYFIGGKMSNYFKKVHKNSRLIQTQPFKFHCSAPLYQQAFEWFREKHNLILDIVGFYSGHQLPLTYLNRQKPKGYFVWDYYDENFSEDKAIKFKTYQQARLESLKKLIEILKNK